MARNISIIADTLTYRWTDVPDRKYRNWLKMSRPKALVNTGDYSVDGYPPHLQIEPTNRCNLSCPLCPTGRGELGREPAEMSLETFRSIIDDMEPYLLFVTLWNWGEPFLHPRLPEMIRHASEREIKVITSTNAHFLHDEAYLARILASGLSTLVVAIDSLDEETYRLYRRKGNLDRAFAGLKRLVELKRETGSPTRVQLRTLVMKQNESELKRIGTLARELGVDRFTLKTINPSCGPTTLSAFLPENRRFRRYRYRKGTDEPVRRQDAVCYQVWEMSNIFADGSVVPCCYDYSASMAVGNVRVAPFPEIWNGEAYRALRRRVLHQNERLPVCGVCGIHYQTSDQGWAVQPFPRARRVCRRLYNRLAGGSMRPT